MRNIVLGSLFFVLLSSCGQEPQTVEELQKAGEIAFGEADYAEARKLLAKAVAQRPSDPHLLYLLGVSYQRDYLYDSAFTYLKRADILFPNDRETNLALYDIAKALKEWRSAIKAIQVLIKTGDPADQYDRELAELNINNENYPVAYYYFRKLLQKEPDSSSHYLTVANLATELDSFEIAINVVDSAIERFGSSDELLVNKGMYLTALKKYGDGEGIFRSLMAKDSTASAYKLNLANALASQNNRTKKAEAYRLYLSIKDAFGPEFRIDSLLQALEEELDIKKSDK